ncbi:hypothetical protein ACFYT4_20485 [Streptomyces sp. NPDC004609]
MLNFADDKRSTPHKQRHTVKRIVERPLDEHGADQMVRGHAP